MSALPLTEWHPSDRSDPIELLEQLGAEFMADLRAEVPGLDLPEAVRVVAWGDADRAASARMATSYLVAMVAIERVTERSSVEIGRSAAEAVERAARSAGISDEASACAAVDAARHYAWAAASGRTAVLELWTRGYWVVGLLPSGVLALWAPPRSGAVDDGALLR